MSLGSFILKAEANAVHCKHQRGWLQLRWILMSTYKPARFYDLAVTVASLLMRRIVTFAICKSCAGTGNDIALLISRVLLKVIHNVLPKHFFGVVNILEMHHCFRAVMST